MQENSRLAFDYFFREFIGVKFHLFVIIFSFSKSNVVSFLLLLQSWIHGLRYRKKRKKDTYDIKFGGMIWISMIV